MNRPDLNSLSSQLIYKELFYQLEPYEYTVISKENLRVDIVTCVSTEGETRGNDDQRGVANQGSRIVTQPE